MSHKKLVVLTAAEIQIRNILAPKSVMGKPCIPEQYRATARYPIRPGKNVKQGKDDTLFAIINGIVKFTRKKNCVLTAR